MDRKTLTGLIMLALLLPGNIYLGYRYFVDKAVQEAEFKVEGNKNDFLCRWQSNMASVMVEDGRITAVGAAAGESDFYWGVAGNYFILNFNKAMAVDFDRNFLADYILMPDGKKYIQVNGSLVAIAKGDLKNKTATLPDGKVMVWQNGHWQ